MTVPPPIPRLFSADLHLQCYHQFFTRPTPLITECHHLFNARPFPSISQPITEYRDQFNADSSPFNIWQSAATNSALVRPRHTSTRRSFRRSRNKRRQNAGRNSSKRSVHRFSRVSGVMIWKMLKYFQMPKIYITTAYFLFGCLSVLSIRRHVPCFLAY